MQSEGTVYFPLTLQQQELMARILRKAEMDDIRGRALLKEQVQAAALVRELPFDVSDKRLQSGAQLLELHRE